MGGVRKRGKLYYYRFVDESGKRREVKGTEGLRETRELLAAAQARAARIRAGLSDGSEEDKARHAGRPLAGHLEDWARSMRDRGLSAAHADLFRSRVARLVALIRGADLAGLRRVRGSRGDADAAEARLLEAARLADLSRDRIQGALAALREAGRSAQTLNHYRAAVRAFCLWAASDGRMAADPAGQVRRYNVDADRRHSRRSLEPGEVARLIAAAASGPPRAGMPGDVRAAAYRVAAATGFRLEEVRSLTPDSCRLDGPNPEIVLPGSKTKNGKDARQPIPAALVDPLRRYLLVMSEMPETPPGAPVFPLAYYRMARAMRADLAAAGIPHRTDAGRLDFHSLRVTYITQLVRSGANIKVVQQLARHASPTTTLQHYARATEADLRAAVESLNEGDR